MSRQASSGFRFERRQCVLVRRPIFWPYRCTTMYAFLIECRPTLLLMLPLLAVGAVGCSSPTGPAPGDTQAQHDFWTKQPADVREETLREDLARTCPAASPAEVAAVAAVAVRYGERLREEYGLTRPV